MISAVVPVKGLDDAKSRMFPERAREELEALSLAMMSDLVRCLCAVPELDRVAVTTPDARVADAAKQAGAEPLLRDDPGLNAAIEAACHQLAGPSDGVLVVLGDVAAAAPDDIHALLEAGPEHGVSLAPSNDGGTSALFRRPPDVIPARFGRDSAARHRDAALAAGVPYVECTLPSLAIDIDFVEDARSALDVESLGPATRAILEVWERS
ncbi:MAG: 2-phospho-L-lactate guanylyltransferase [Myxococcota bacterium]